ncbi:hypothetical protein [Streptomyces yanii]|uniref:hypothetical protein n=1 Tax=Streptomyces yanii TaxID=78510 RepID=UPI0031EF5E56
MAAPALGEDCSRLSPHVAALYEADRLADGEAQVRHTGAFHGSWCGPAGNAVLLHTLGGAGHRGVHGSSRSGGWGRCRSRTRRSTRR